VNVLLHHLIDDHITLTPEQNKIIRRETMKRFSAEPRANLLRMIPGMLPLLAIPFILKVRSRYGMLADVIFELVIVAAGLAIMYWLFRRAFKRHARAAIRDLGIADICPMCGYDQRNRVRTSGCDRCPECGATLGPFQPEEPS